MTFLRREKAHLILAFLCSLLMAACASSPPPATTPTGPSAPAWVNPTGLSVRGCDPQGCGTYGAPRKVGPHKGADYTAAAGQDVFASVSGVVDKIGYPYNDDLSYRYIKIVSSDGYVVRELYVLPVPGLAVGDSVTAGMVIGTEQPLSKRYPGITEHSHTDIQKNNSWVDPETLIP